MKNVLPDGASADVGVARGDKIVCVGGEDVSDTCTVEDFIALVQSKERPLNVEFLQRKQVKEIHRSKQELKRSKRKIELEAKLKENEGLRNNQILIQSGKSPVSLSFELGESCVSEKFEEQANRSKSKAASQPNVTNENVFCDSLEAVVQLSSDLSLCDMVETSASHGFTKGIAGAERASPRTLWQHSIWAHDLDTTNSNCKAGNSLIGSTWSDTVDPLAGCTIGGGGKYGGGAGEYDFLDASSAHVQGSAVHDILESRSGDISATMQHFSFCQFKGQLKALIDVQDSGAKESKAHSSHEGYMPESFLTYNMGRRHRFAMYTRLARCVVSTNLVGYLGPNGLLEDQN